VKKYLIVGILISCCSSNYSIEYDKQVIKGKKIVDSEIIRNKNTTNNQSVVKHLTEKDESFSNFCPEQYCTYANLSIGYVAAHDELDQSANERKCCTPSAVSGCLKFKHRKRSSSL